MLRWTSYVKRFTLGASHGPPQSASGSIQLGYIEETLENGGITIGFIPPLSECVAVAHKGRHTLAMLKRQKGESLAQLLFRLDLAIARAHTDDIFTDEITRSQNSGAPSSCIPSAQDGLKRTVTSKANIF